MPAKKNFKNTNLVLTGKSKDPGMLFGNPAVLGITAFILLSVLFSFIIIQRYELVKASNKKEAYDIVHQAKESIQETLTHSLAATKTLTFFIDKNGNVNLFDSIAAQIIESNNDIDILQLVPGGVIKYIYPLKGNESVLGYNILKDSSRNKEAFKAIEKKELFFAGPLALRQGGTGVVGRLPVYRNNNFWGFSAVVIKMSTLLKIAGIDSAGKNGYYFQLSKINPDTKTAEYFLPRHDFESDLQAVSVTVPNGEWKLSVSQPASSRSFGDITLLSLMGFLFAVFGAMFIYRISVQPKKLQKLVINRTMALEAGEHKYRSLIERVSDGFIAIDTNWNYTYINEKAGEIFVREPQSLIGKNIWKAYPEGVGRPFYHAYYRAMELQEYQYLEEYDPIFNKWFESHIYPSTDGLSVFFKDVTEIKQITIALKDNEEKYRSLIEQASDGIVITDMEGVILEVNKSMMGMLGLNNEEMIGYHLSGFLPEKDVEKIPLRIHELMQGKSLLYERRLAKKDGTILAVEVNSKMASSHTLIGFVRDITERKKYENTLIYQATLLDNVSDAITSLDMNRVIVSWNNASEELYGFTAAEAIGKRIPELVNFQFPDTGYEQLFKQVFNEGFWKGEFNFIHPKTKEKINLLSSISLLKTKNNEVTGFIITGKNIIERKKAEEAIKKSNERYRSLLNNLDAGVVVHAADTSIVTSNPKASQLLGLSKDQLKGKLAIDPSWCFMDNDLISLPVEKYPVNEIIATGQAIKNLIFAVNRPETKDVVWLIVNGFPVFTVNGEIAEVVISFIDITELKKIEYEKAKEHRENEALINSTTDLLWSVSTAYTLIAANNTFINAVKEKDNNLLKAGTDVLSADFFQGEFFEHWKNIFSRGLAGEKILSEICTSETAEKALHWFEIKIDPIAVDEKITGIACSMRNITGRKKAAQEIEKANERFELIGKVTHDAVWEWNLETGMRWGNEAHQQFYGLTMADPVPDEVAWKKRLHHNERDRLTTLLETALASDRNSFEAEYLFYTENRGWANIFASTYIDRNQAGKVIRLVGNMTDMTERKKAARDILQSKKQFQNLIENISGVYWVNNLDTNQTLYISPSYETIWGIKCGDLYSNPDNFINAVHPDDKTILLEAYKNIGNTLKSEIAYRIIRPDGEIRWISARTNVVVDAAGIKTEYGYAEDITEQKKAAEDLFQSEQKYKLLFYNNPLPMWMTTIPGLDIIDVNDAAINQYGYSREEFLTLNTRQLRPAEDVENFLKEVDKMHSGGINIRNWRHQKKDGTVIYVETYSHEIMYEGKLTWLGLSHDVTEKYHAKELLQKSYEDIRQLASNLQGIREDERTNIAREIHDELGQQLTGLKMDLHWLSRKIINTDDDVIFKMKESIELINATIASVRKIATDLRPSILDDLGLTAALEWQGAEFAKRSGLKVKFINKAGDISVQPEAATGIFRIYQELLTNIARHANAGMVRALLYTDKTTLFFTVNDNGKGFDLETIKHKKTLGLLGIKERTLLLGGTYEFKSKPGEGTITYISIPLIN